MRPFALNLGPCNTAASFNKAKTSAMPGSCNVRQGGQYAVLVSGVNMVVLVLSLFPHSYESLVILTSLQADSQPD